MNPHVTDGEIARLIDGELGERVAAEVRAHLRGCRRCFAAYQDTLVLRGLWLNDPARFEPEDGIVSAGLRVEGGSLPDEGAVRRGGGRTSPKYRRWSVAAAVAAVVLVIVLWWFWPGGMGDQGVPTVPPTVLAPVRAAVETVSMWGPFVLPGGEGALESAGPVYRTGFVTLTDSLEWSLDQLYGLARKEPSPTEIVSWLIGGYLATGQIDLARDLMRDPRFGRLTDPRIVILKALIAYMEEDFDRAENLLRGLLEADPSDPVASINLAVVLDRRGNTSEAAAILRRVDRDHAGTPVAVRARSLLSALESE